MTLFKHAGVEWKDVAPVLDTITDEDVERGIQHILKKVLDELVLTHTSSAKKWVIAQLKRVIPLENEHEMGEDAAPRVAGLRRECTTD